MTPAQDAASDDPHATSLIQLLAAVEVAHAIDEAASCRSTPHGTSDSRCLEGHDHALVQRRRERRAFSDTLAMLSGFELLESDAARGDFEQRARTSAEAMTSVESDDRCKEEEQDDERGNFEQSAPVVLPKTHSRNPDQNCKNALPHVSQTHAAAHPYASACA